MPTRARLAAALRISLGIATALVVLEASILWLFAHPWQVARLPLGAEANLRQLYAWVADVVHLDTELARYDPELFYTLRPGHHRFRNPEFDVAFDVNSFGLRDDERSLAGPEAIVLGDSYAMGWGVESAQTFAQIIEDASGLRVLDAAVSSYGTVREMRMLDRLDTSRLSHLIIQYCSNDIVENLPYFEQKGAFAVEDESTWLSLVETQKRRGRYIPGYYTYELVRQSIGSIFDAAPLDDRPLRVDAEAFLYVLTHGHRRALDGVQLILVELNGAGQNDGAFSAEVRRRIHDPEYPAYVRDMIVANVSGRLTREQHFVLDEHLNASGHRVVADVLLRHVANRRATTR